MVFATELDQTDVDIGRNIYNLRKQWGMSQGELGDKIGVSFQQVQKYEKGHNRVASSTLVAVCEALQCDYKDILPPLKREHRVVDEVDKFVSPKPLPGDYEHEILTIFMEECNEAAIRASKLKRFGRDEIQPGKTLTNSERLSAEIGDIFAVVEKLVDCGLVDGIDIDISRKHKHEKLKKFMQTM
jgi:transcriptional regulator with XRE-family HTH domain